MVVDEMLADDAATLRDALSKNSDEISVSLSLPREVAKRGSDTPGCRA